jgi:hypothetical protein
MHLKLTNRVRHENRGQCARDRAIADSENADHPGLAYVSMDLTAELGELTGDELGGAVSSKPSSGWACRSWRQAVISP